MNDQPLILRITSLNNQIKRLLERTFVGDNEADLTGMQYAILGFLGDQDETKDIYPKHIETVFNIRRSTTSETLKSLEKKGLIYRAYDTVDTRQKKIFITEKAKKINSHAKYNMELIQIRLTKGISPEEIKQFSKILQKIMHNAQE